MRSIIIALGVWLAGCPAWCATPCAANRAGQCFTVHGRLLAYNGTPTFRIWPVGSKRLLGVVGPNGDAEDPALPEVIARVRGQGDAFQTAVFGDYQVCPLRRSRPGRMQEVCVSRATHLSVRPR